jgi:hypothetical protein
MEIMKRSQDKHTEKQQIHTIQRIFMEVTQRIQPIQEKAYQLFIEVEGQGAEIDQFVTTTEQRLEGPINDVFIQEFIEQEDIAQQ